MQAMPCPLEIQIIHTTGLSIGKSMPALPRTPSGLLCEFHPIAHRPGTYMKPHRKDAGWLIVPLALLA